MVKMSVQVAQFDPDNHHNLSSLQTQRFDQNFLSCPKIISLHVQIQLEFQNEILHFNSVSNFEQW